MSVLDRSALVDSPLADLHTIASELSIDGYRRLRRDELIDAIIEKQGGDPSIGKAEEPEESSGGSRRRRSRRGRGSAGADEEATAEDTSDAKAEGEEKTEESDKDEADEDAAEKPRPRRSRSRSRKSEAESAETAAETTPEPAESTEEADEPEEKPSRSRRGRGRASEDRSENGAAEDETVEGTVEVLANGSGFVRLGGSPDADVYISSAQVKRCELVSGDTVSGPRRAPRRSERFASLIRIETINGRPASEQADTVRFDDLPASLPTTLIDLADDSVLKAVQAIAPFGQGSRVTIAGPSRAGKTELLRAIAAVLADEKELTVSVALAGVRPEELGEWSGDSAPASAVSFAAPEDARAAALEAVVDQARRLAARGSHAVVLIDTLDGLAAHTARKLMASARNLTDGGSVTIVATAAAPVGGETTVISLDLAAASAGRFPAIDLFESGTLRPERLVGESAAKKIARERAKALKD